MEITGSDTADLILLAIIIAAGVFFFIWQAEQSGKVQSEKLTEAARQLGFSPESPYDPYGHQPALPTELLEIPLLKPLAQQPSFIDAAFAGSSGSVTNVFRGHVNGYEAKILAYDLLQGKVSVHFLVVCIDLKTAALPEFRLWPKMMLYTFSSGDINFTTHPDFSKDYLLYASDKKAAQALFQPEVLSYFAQHKSLQVESAGSWLAVARRQTKCDFKNLSSFLHEGEQIVQLFLHTSRSCPA